MRKRFWAGVNPGAQSSAAPPLRLPSASDGNPDLIAERWISAASFSALGKAAQALPQKAQKTFMAIKYSFTPRDLEWLEVLTLRVRFLSLAQMARTWWEDSPAGRANAKARLQILARAGLITFFRVMAHPEINLVRPVYAWQPGQAEPNFGAASYRLQSRWRQTAVTTPCVMASRAAGQRFGGHGGRLPRQSEQTHDLHLGALFLQYRQWHPALMRYWIFEERLREEKSAGEKLPDALWRLPEGERVIEFGGAYSKDKLARFHEHCAEKGLPYEMW